jgi:hypothetical protein
MTTLRGVLTNWKTTVAGLIVSVLNLSANGVSIKQILVSSGIALLGAMAKDHNVGKGVE